MGALVTYATVRFAKIRVFCHFRKWAYENDVFFVERACENGDIIAVRNGVRTTFRIQNGILERVPVQHAREDGGYVTDYTGCGPEYEYLPVLELP